MDSPELKIVELIENEDGTVFMSFDTNDVFDNWAKTSLGVEVLTQEDLGEFVKDMLSKAFNNEDGYSFAKQDE